MSDVRRPTSILPVFDLFPCPPATESAKNATLLNLGDFNFSEHFFERVQMNVCFKVRKLKVSYIFMKNTFKNQDPFLKKIVLKSTKTKY